MGSAAYFPGESALRHGIEAGMNYLFWFAWDFQMTRVLRDVLPAQREKFIVATGVGNFGGWVMRHGLDHCLRLLRTDYIDVFHIFWAGDRSLTPRTLDLLRRFKDEGKIRAIAMSTHVRPYAASLVRRGDLDVLMMRYNAAHRGAEQEIFPCLDCSHPGVVAYTATRWRKLLQRPRGWPAGARVPTAGDCYRFVLSNPHVDVCLTAPRSREQLTQNLAAVGQGPLGDEDLRFMHEFGEAVRRRHSFIM